MIPDSVLETNNGFAIAVYAALANQADRSIWECSPSAASLAEQCSISRTSVFVALKFLEERGLIERRKRTDSAGKLPTTYILKATIDLFERMNADKQGNPPGVLPQASHAQGNPPGVLGSPLHGHTVKDKPKRTKEDTESCSNSLVREAFTTWYKSYPKREKRVDAEKAWMKLTPRERELAVEGLPSFQFSNDPKYIPLPATWLNSKRWEDEPTQGTQRASGPKFNARGQRVYTLADLREEQDEQRRDEETVVETSGWVVQN